MLLLLLCVAVKMEDMRERAFALLGRGRALQRGRGGEGVSSRLCGYTLLNFYNRFYLVY